jgi:hypothetical protein
MAGGCARAQQPCDLVCHFTLATQAVEQGRYEDYLRHAQSMAALAPTFPGIVYAVARGFALTGRLEESEQALTQLAASGDARDVTTDTVFARLRGRPQFAAAAERLRQNQSAIVRGSMAVELPDPDQLPEAFAYDVARDRFLVGSLAKRKIVALSRDGPVNDFIVAPGMLRVVGIHIDSVRSQLWFATWEPRQGSVPDTTDRPSVTRLFKADLTTGRILREYAPRDSVFGHLFNDLVIAANSDVYITDTDHGWLYCVRASSDTLEVYLRPDATRFANPNGVTLSRDGRGLYVGFTQGIARVDLATRRIALVDTPDTVSAAGVDGLYAYQGVLIGVQHMPTLSRIAEFTLSADGHAIVRSRTLERGSEILRLPTTGQVVGTRFYYIATSQYDRIDDHNRIAPAPASLARSRIRVIDLDP